MAISTSISMQASKYTWEDVDKRAESLGYDRSSYIQKLTELDIDTSLLSNPIMIGWIRKGRKQTIRMIDYIILLFVIGLTLLILASILLW